MDTWKTHYYFGCRICRVAWHLTVFDDEGWNSLARPGPDDIEEIKPPCEHIQNNELPDQLIDKRHETYGYSIEANV